MKIEFNDEILKGEIVIDRPLTIFTGRNGTGKTYAAKKLIGENFYYFGLKAQEISNGYWYPTDSGDFFDLAKQIETELFDCAIGWSAGWFNINHNKLGKNIIEYAPSSVLSFFSLIIDLKYQIKRNATIILDCPETHQDNYNQSLIGRFIPRLTNAGLKVVLVTHSNNIIFELCNLMILSNIPENKTKSKLMGDLTIDKGMQIDHKQIRHYFFENNEIKELEVDMGEFNPIGLTHNPIDSYINRLRISALWDKTHIGKKRPV